MSCHNFPKDNAPITISILNQISPFIPFNLHFLSSITKLMAKKASAVLHIINLLSALSCTIWVWQGGASESPGREMRQATMKSSRPQYALNKQKANNECTKDVYETGLYYYMEAWILYDLNVCTLAFLWAYAQAAHGQTKQHSQ